MAIDSNLADDSSLISASIARSNGAMPASRSFSGPVRHHSLDIVLTDAGVTSSWAAAGSAAKVN